MQRGGTRKKKTKADKGLVYIRCRGPHSLNKEHWFWAVNRFQFCTRCQEMVKHIRTAPMAISAEDIMRDEY